MQPIHTLSFIVHLHQKEKNTKKMEGCDQNGSGVGNGGSRWNPTKDQINMLEGLYKQGLRTPSAQQIQQITARLRDFGHIEGKNVFYWFQNHKARQRQKQKQIKHDNFAYFNRFTHPPNPVFPPFQNVVCSPCYSMPPPNPSGFYQQYPKVQPPTAAGGGGGNIVMKRNSRVVIPDQSSCDSNAVVARYNKPMHEYYNPRRQSPHHHQETLDLFPIHPTGVLIENKKKKPTNTSSSSEHDNDQSALAHEKAGKDNHFFDFFSCHN